jgi:hypothetical protein
VEHETYPQQSQQQTSVSERAADVATGARDEARSVAHDARQEAGHVASEAAAQARSVADEARSALRAQARQGTDRAASALDQAGGRLRSLAQGDPSASGDLRRYADQAGERLQAVAGRLDERGFDGMVDDLQSFARRRPGVFLAAAATAGFVAGRFFRGAKAAEARTNEEGNGREPGGNGRTDASPSTPASTPAPVREHEPPAPPVAPTPQPQAVAPHRAEEGPR